MLTLATQACNTASTVASDAGLDATPPFEAQLDGGTDAGPGQDASPPDSEVVDAAVPDAELPDAARPDAELPDAGETRGPLPIDAPLNARPALLLPGEPAGMAALDDALYAVLDGQLWRWQATGVEDLGPAPGTLRAVSQLGETSLFLFEPGGIYLLGEAGPEPSALDLETVRTLLAPSPEVLLLADDETFWRMSAGRLAPFAVAGVDAAAVQPLKAGRWAGAPAAWFVAGSTIYVLHDAARSPAVVAVATLPGPVDAIAPQPDGSVWASAAGVVWQFLPEIGRFRPEGLPAAPRDVASHPQSADTWWRTSRGLWHSRDGRFRPVHGLDAAPESLVVLADGALVYASEAGLMRVPVGRLFSLDAPPAGQVLEGPVTLSLNPSAPDAVVTVDWRVDAEPAQTVAGPPWRISVDPEAYAAGEHVLTARAIHEDDEILELSWRFVVAEAPTGPTWNTDVGPLFAARCAGACHGDRGAAHRLDSSDRWRAEIDAIVSAVSSARMPLGADPLEPAQVALIEAWRAAGMPEE
jgi:mono/diheme cytochrome c family protein